MTTHTLKTAAAYFDAVWSGEKTFEVRYDDRGYQRGHGVRLREFDASIPCTECPRDPGQPWHVSDGCAKYSGREITATVGHVLATTPAPSKSRPGFNGHGYVVFSLLNVERGERQAAATAPGPDGNGLLMKFGEVRVTSTGITSVSGGSGLVTAAEAARRIAGGDRS